MLQALAALSLTAGWSLDWAAPAGCTQAPELQARLEARVKRQLFSPPARFLIQGRVEAGAPGWRAHVELVDSKGNALGSRDVSSSEPGCSSLDARLVLVLALLVEPLSAEEPAIVLTTPAPAPSLSAEPATDTPMLLERTVHVRAISDAPGTHLLTLKTGRVGRGWYERTSDLCVCPCELDVALPADVFAAGDGIVASRAIPLAADLDGRSVSLDVRAGSAGLRVGSVLATTVGSVVLSAALIALSLLLVTRGEAWSVGAAGAGAAVGAGALTLGIVGLHVTQTEVDVSLR